MSTNSTNSFKPGDWVRFTQTSTQIEQYDGKPYHKNVQVEPWQPQPNEFCWFYNSDSDIPIFDLFLKRKKFAYCSQHRHGTRNTFKWKHCEPYLGTLPTKLKIKPYEETVGVNK